MKQRFQNKSTSYKINSIIIIMLSVIIGGVFIASAQAKKNENGSLNSDQIRAVNKISSYLNKFKTVNGDFLQTAPDGSNAKGKYYIQRPGMIRFEYNPPVPLLVVSNGDTLFVMNKKENKTQEFPLSLTPLRLLLAKKIDLLKEAKIIFVNEDINTLAVTMEDARKSVPGQLTLVFSNKKFALKKWIVVDAQGYQTTVDIKSLKGNQKISPKKFEMKNWNIFDTAEN